MKPSTIAAVIPETHPLIEAVTEPLAANAERRMAAHAFLGEKFDAAHPGVAAAAARLEAAGKRKFTALCKVLPWVLAAMALVVAVASHAQTFRFASLVYNYEMFEPWEKPPLPAGLTEKQRLLLGDPDLDDLEQKRRLHILVPENPAYYAEYAQDFVSHRSRLPADFLETAALIAADCQRISWRPQPSSPRTTRFSPTSPPGRSSGNLWRGKSRAPVPHRSA